MHRSIRRLPALGAALFTLAILGCGGGAGDDGPLGTAEEASVCAAGATVKGVDVSVFQGNVDWPTVKGPGGIDFAIARVSDGMFMDVDFDQNWSGMKSAGLVRGVYQFFEPGEDPTAQANIVIGKVGTLGAGDLPATLDVEVTGGQSPATIASHIKTWVDAITAGTGKAPMIYTALGFWDGSVASASFGDLPLWAANWGVNCPSLATGWNDWKIWQYADNGSVSGIPATVDLDEFNGDLAALQAFAGQEADWGAQYVSQSWPLASTTMMLTVNQQLPASITLKNIGAKSWDAKTRLGTTQPHDRASPFAGPDWIAPNRPAGVSGTVAPGATYEFQFTFYAPGTPGMFDEFYGVLEEGVHWFSDPGEAGPPDDDIEAKIQVVEAQYHGTYVSQTFPTLQEPAIEMTIGGTLLGTITLKNVGTAPWKAGVTKLAPTPRDEASSLAGPAWLSPTRVSSPPADVPPGQSYAFPLELRANEHGDFTQTFSLVEEGITWFADAPKGGGPPDDLLAVHVVVGSARDRDAGSGDEADGGSQEAEESQAGCSCGAAGDGRGEGGAAWLAAAMGVVIARRRKRVAPAARLEAA